MSRTVHVKSVTSTRTNTTRSKPREGSTGTARADEIATRKMEEEMATALARHGESTVYMELAREEALELIQQTFAQDSPDPENVAVCVLTLNDVKVRDVVVLWISLMGDEELLHASRLLRIGLGVLGGQTIDSELFGLAPGLTVLAITETLRGNMERSEQVAKLALGFDPGYMLAKHVAGWRKSGYTEKDMRLSLSRLTYDEVRYGAL